MKLGELDHRDRSGHDRRRRYQHVGPLEADPVEGRISNESPLGKVILGVKVGEVVGVDAPRGVTEFRVLRVDKPLTKNSTQRRKDAKKKAFFASLRFAFRSCGE